MIKQKWKPWRSQWTRQRNRNMHRIMAFNLMLVRKLYALVVAATPRATGTTARSWVVKKLDKLRWTLYNSSKAANIIEFGGFKKIREQARKVQRAYFASKPAAPKNNLVRGTSGYTETWAHKDAPRGILRISIEKLVELYNKNK